MAPGFFVLELRRLRVKNFFSRLRRTVWTSVLAVLFCAVSFWCAVKGLELQTFASGMSAATFALLSLRASR